MTSFAQNGRNISKYIKKLKFWWITRYFFKNSSQASNATEAPVNAVEDTEVATANATVIENVAMSTDCADKTDIYMDQLEQTENLVASTPLKC